MENLIKLKYIILLLCLTVAISACNDNDDDDIDPVPISFVSIYHASPNSPSLNVFLDNSRINFYPLFYTDYTGYLNFFSGERNMRVSPVNASNVVIDSTFTFTQGEAYSIFYVNSFDNIEALLVSDDFVSLNAGDAAIRFIHLSPDAPEVDLIREADGSSSTIADDQEYLVASDFMTVTSGQQSFRVTTADNSQVLLSVPDVNLSSGRVYTIIARGFANPPAGNNNNLSADIVINN